MGLTEAIKDDAAITGEEGMGGEIGRLRHAHFAGSALDKCDIKILNAQAALIDALWVRRDTAGGNGAIWCHLLYGFDG
jgi:hypothetical protein